MPSENGWEPARLPADSPLLVWKTVPGTTVNLQVMRGLPEVVIPAVAADFNAYVEPLRDPDSASYTPTNSVATSNHLNGTAADLNWNSHAFQVRGTFTTAQMVVIRQLLDFYEGWIYWAGDWDSPVDEMHWQMGYNTWNRNTAALDFFARKIRSDGFSTFRRGPLAGDPPAPAEPSAPSPDADRPDDAVQVLYDAVPVIDEARAAELVAAVREGLAAAQCANVKRIAMYLAQCGHESDGFATTEEYASGADYEGRTDLGNTQPGDGVRFKGRSWIQVTGRSNYQAFSQWACDTGITTDNAYFVNNPAALAELQYAGVGAAWYWTVARPDINSLSDAGDVNTVTRRINGGTNGLQDRINRYNQAVALGDRLLLLIAPTSTKGPLMALTDDEQQELLTKTREVWDQLRGPDGTGWPQLGQNDQGQNHTPVDAIADIQSVLDQVDLGLVGLGGALQSAITQAVQAELAKAQQPAP